MNLFYSPSSLTVRQSVQDLKQKNQELHKDIVKYEFSSSNSGFESSKFHWKRVALMLIPRMCGKQPLLCSVMAVWQLVK